MFECLEEVHYGAMDMRADASGGGPVGLPYLFAMMTGAAVGMYAVILAWVNAVIVLILSVIRRRKGKVIRSMKNGNKI